METQVEGVFPKVLVFYMTRASNSLLIPGVTEVNVKTCSLLWREGGRRECKLQWGCKVN